MFEITKVDFTVVLFIYLFILYILYILFTLEKVGEKATIRNRHNRLPRLVLNPKWG